MLSTVYMLQNWCFVKALEFARGMHFATRATIAGVRCDVIAADRRATRALLVTGEPLTIAVHCHGGAFIARFEAVVSAAARARENRSPPRGECAAV